jgi:outer membrane lipoprotein carrier protein
MTSHGELVRKKPNLLSISFSDPAKDRIVADGTSLWLYLPSSAPGQVIKLPASKSPGAMIDPLGQVLSSPAERFTLTDAGKAVINQHATHAVTMVPKRGSNAPFTQATVWVDDKDGTVRQIETTEPSGVNRRIVITKFAPGVTVPRGKFVFTPPANVRVVDGQMGL